MAKFWVIFDTCQFPQYYQDVHNLLALPPGTALRYDYKTKYLSSDAIQFADDGGSSPILLVYAQKQIQYTRNNERSQIPEGEHAAKYVATRCATMLAVAKDADNYYFDFKLGAYPAQGEAFDSIIARLVVDHEVPWAKWICTSTFFPEFEKLPLGDDHPKWAAIVELLKTQPMQFAGDAFWRIKGPYEGQSEGTYKSEVELITESGKTRQARVFFPLGEDRVARLELISETGRQDGVPQNFEVTARSSDESVLKVVGHGIYKLRHYTGQMIEYRTLRAALIGHIGAHLVLNTVPQPTVWPVGANISLDHRVRRNRLRLWSGAVLGILGAVLFAVGDTKILEDSYPVLSVAMKAGGVVLLVMAGFVLTGEFKFPGA